MKNPIRARSLFALGVCSLSMWAVSYAAPVPSTPATPSTPAVAVKLTENGRALLPIVVAADASREVRKTADTLAEYLKRISSGEFKVETATAPFTDASKGIVLGVASQFPTLKGNLKPDDPTHLDDYILRSHTDGVLLAGASELALNHAVWDFLYRLGYRQFFPGDKWEIVPSEKNLSIAVNSDEHPDYYVRRIWYGYGTLAENRDSNELWNERNRGVAAAVLSTGHAYGTIIEENKAEFEKHPEYFANPRSKDKKFCVSNPGLRQLVINYALKKFAENPQLQSLSMEPSDGGGWETSDSCSDATEYKSITDRAITLANVVAEAVEKKYPGKLIGLFAYNEHSPPPTIKAHPNVVVSIATSFIKGGYSLDDLLNGWSEKATTLGIREYYSVHPWDQDLPGKSRGGNIEYLRRTIPHFYEKGARFMSAESGDNWGPNGLGYYLASRMLWDTKAAGKVEALTDDFLTRAFGAASEPMREYYRLLDGSRKPLLSTDLVGRMYRQLNAAYEKTDDPAVRARLHDLALYTRYVELYAEYSQAAGAQRQEAFEAVLRFAWRIRASHMIHTLALWRDLPKRDPQVKVPADANYKVPEPKNPWKSSEPFTNDQVQKFIADGIAHNAIVDFEAVGFSTDLVPATPLKLSSKTVGTFDFLRGSQNLYTWVVKAPATITLQARGGMVYKTFGDANFSLFPAAEPEGESVAEQAIAPDKQSHEVELKTTFTGLHRINVTDKSAGTEISWREGTPMTFESSLESAVRFSGNWSLYFYVPKGTKVVGGYRIGTGRVLDSDGKVVANLDKENSPGYWSTPVAPGQDGKLWMLSDASGQIKLMTVPPYLARSAAEMLLPKEVVEADTNR